MFGFIADLLGKWVTELVIGSIHNVYTFLLIALDVASVAFLMQNFLKFNKVISWLVGLLVLVLLSEHIIINKSPWSMHLIPSVVGLLFLILLIIMLRSLASKPEQRRDRAVIVRK